MKRTHILLLFAALAVSAFAAVKKPLVSSVEPPYWWTGMANDTLQLFIYGNDVKNARMSVDYPGVDIVGYGVQMQAGSSYSQRASRLRASFGPRFG